MLSNDQVILDQVLTARGDEVAPEMSESQFFEVFSSEQILKGRDLSWDDLQRASWKWRRWWNRLGFSLCKPFAYS